MVQVNQLNRRQTLLRYLGCYALWALLIALGYVAIFMIWRMTILTLLAGFAARSAWNGFLYLLSMLLLGTSLFILVLAAEVYLRTGVRRRQLLKRFARIAVPLGGAGLLGLLLQDLALAILR